MRMIPSLKASSRLHLMVPSVEHLTAISRLIVLLLKLGIVTNPEILGIPAVTEYPIK